jgi:hypothetical protein
VGDFFAFRRMIAPVLIHIFFWVASLSLLALGVLMAIDKMDPVWERMPEMKEATKGMSGKEYLKSLWEGLGSAKMLVGIAVAIGGPFFIRIYSELLMLPFRINDTLTDIRNLSKLQHPSPAASAPAGMPRR